MADLNFGVSDINMIADVVRSHSNELKEIDDFCGRVSDWTFKCSDNLDNLDARLALLESRMDAAESDSGVAGTICSLLVLGGIGYVSYRLFKKFKKEKEAVSEDFFEEIRPENVSKEIHDFEVVR